MAVYKRGNRWHYRFQFGGQQYSGSAGATGSRADAIALEARARSDLLSERLGQPKSHTIDDALLRWLSDEAATLRSLDNLRGKVRAILPHTAGRTLDQIADVAHAVRSSGISSGLATATINRRLAILRRIANLAHDQWGWLRDPIGRRIKLLPGERARDTFLTIDQVEQLAGKCTLDAASVAIRLAARTGMREGELLSADTIDDGCILIRGASSKTGRPRRIPVPPDMPALTLPLGLTYPQLRTQFERARLACGLPTIRFHDLRHTAASWWIAAGASLVVVRDFNFSDPECRAREIAALGRTGLIRWSRPEDGQVAYWGPHGASLSRVWFPPPAVRGRKALSADKKRAPVTVKLPPDIIQFLRESDGSQSALIEKAVRLAYGIPQKKP